MRKVRHALPVLQITLSPVLVTLMLLSLNDGTARAAALTDEARASFIKSAEESCFDGQSKQAANRSRKPEQLRALCSCLADKLSYTMTREKLMAAASGPFAPSAEDERVMRAVFDNCWQVHVK
jgi:hypothetical protein